MKLGLEALFTDHRELLRGQKVGLIVHPAAVDSQFRHAADLFAACPEFKLTTLFGPQHGIRGETQDNMIEWEGFIDRRTGVPVYSLYGETRIPTLKMLQEVETLVFDVQDVGTRVYTFIYTMAHAMQACAQYGRRMVVLDRPNPIGGELVEGNVLDPRFASFVGLYPIAMRHGMTVGELALMFNEAFGIGCDLEVVPMQGWRRSMWWDDTSLAWVLPSPNMPTLETATVYPGMVIFEGTLISEGRGTTRPFEIIGGAQINAEDLAQHLNQQTWPGVYFRPHYFQPTFHKFAGQLCGGIQLHVTNRQTYQPVVTALAVLEVIYRHYPTVFGWKQPPYEYVFDHLPIDVIWGSDQVRQALLAGQSAATIAASWQPDVDEFVKLRSKYLLYQ
jgi:uncharacterized protein YbbC (DUF1343 family)